MENRFPQQVEAYGGELDDAVAQLQQRCATYQPPRKSTWASIKRNYIYKPLLHMRIA